MGEWLDFITPVYSRFQDGSDATNIREDLVAKYKKYIMILLQRTFSLQHNIHLFIHLYFTIRTRYKQANERN
ncbi:unnamed protein product [Rhizophagus irregularis]|nr:unnamed protein product [Rhizophagus irregularis]CAB5383923.1 unnamed protein product [Rhizophagus irregularis]